MDLWTMNTDKRMEELPQEMGEEGYRMVKIQNELKMVWASDPWKNWGKGTDRLSELCPVPQMKPAGNREKETFALRRLLQPRIDPLESLSAEKSKGKRAGA